MHPLRNGWAEDEFDVAILKLCLEFPDAPMIAYSRALEHCRRQVPDARHDRLLDTMRVRLQEELARHPPASRRSRIGTS